MKETALLLAQSLICEHKDGQFACERCINCIRIEENNYADLIYIEGDKNIKAEEVEQIRDQFETTALEKAGHKIFIINNCENLTNKSANSLLKFIEEPTGSLTGIFITTQIERVLPTIVSRCQTLNFKPLGKEAFYQKAKDLKLDELDAHFISNLVSGIKDISKLSKNKNYLQAYQLFAEFNHLLFTDKGLAIVYLQKNLTKLNKKDTDKEDKKDEKKDEASTKLNIKTTFTYFLDLCLIFVQDYLEKYSSEDETYNNLLQLVNTRTFDYGLYMKSMIETKDALNRSANTLLLADQLLYKLTEV